MGGMYIHAMAWMASSPGGMYTYATHAEPTNIVCTKQLLVCFATALQL